MFAPVCTRLQPSLAAAQPLPFARGTRQGQAARVLTRLGLAGLLAVGVGSTSSPSYGQERPAAKPAEQNQNQEVAKDDEQAQWTPLFDGKTLDGWKVTGFGGQGVVEVQDGSIVLGMGSALTGITYQEEFPKCDYEIQWEARRLEGVDFFSTLTFPVQDAFCSLVVGGWAGAVVGLSNLDYADASENATTRYMKFNKEQWYRFRLVVRRDRIRAWIDDESVVDVDITKRKLGTRIEVRLSQPLGFTTWETRGALRKIQYRPLPPAGDAPPQTPPAPDASSPPKKDNG